MKPHIRVTLIKCMLQYMNFYSHCQFFLALSLNRLEFQYHAREHYWKIAKIAFSDKEERNSWTAIQKEALNQGDVEQIINAMEKLSVSTEEAKKEIEKEIGYFGKNKKRMRYNKLKKQGFFVGSGVLEAGCRAVIGERLKQSGMHWSVRGANNIIALRTCFFSNRGGGFPGVSGMRLN